MPGVTHDSRMKDFKNTGRHEDARRRRAEGSVELRKAKKEDNLMKRRNMMLAEEESGAEEATLVGPEGDGKGSPGQKEGFVERSLEECGTVLLGGWESSSVAEKESAVENVRRKLSRSSSPPIQHVLDLGLVRPLVAILEAVPSEKAQFEAAWALTNIVSGSAEETAAVVAAGGIGPLIKALSSPALYVAEQAAWALGNIAGDGATLRDAVLDAGVLPAMVTLASRPDVSVEFLRTLAWAFSNFCRHKNPAPRLEVIQCLLPYMGRLLGHTDKVVVTDTCWAVSYVTDGADEQIAAVLEAGILPRVAEILGSSEPSLQAPALRTLGNVVTGSDQHTQAVVDTGILATLMPTLLRSARSNLVKETVWLLSNVLAGNPSQIQAVMDAGLLPDLCRLLGEAEHKVRHEAAWAIVNLTTGGEANQLLALVEAGLVPHLCGVLDVKDTRVVNILLEALHNILDKAKAAGHLEKLAEMVEEAGGLDKLEELQNHEDSNVYAKAVGIIETFFQDDEDNDDAAHNDQGAQNDHAADAPSAGAYNF